MRARRVAWLGALRDVPPFRTLKRRLKITFDEAHIFDSGDLIGDGEPTWFFTARWDTTGDAGVLLVDGCFPYTADPPDAQGDARSLCLQGDTGQASTITDPSDGGRVLPFATPAGQPLALVFAEENFGGRLPDRISIVSWAKEDDSDLGILDELGRCFAFQCGSFDASGLPWLHWQVPDGELSVDQIRLHANASRDEGFRSDVLATLTVYYDDRVYTGYTGGGQVVSTFPIGSTLRIHR